MIKESPKPRITLINLRKQKGSQRKVASDLDITDTYLRMLEKGQATPSVDLLFKTAHYFGTDVYSCWPDLSGDRPDRSSENSIQRN
ncbi:MULTISPECIES: helix-turn-helix domain-containing protein [Paenibacillus]|jgi:transcriptional regulator with XRE-family HTH domain|uniref:helix-turn-helix domain-containing protein n=1 Tax=Paenibacillus TaxID=44249 RepID=UPI00350E45FE